MTDGTLVARYQGAEASRTGPDDDWIKDRLERKRRIAARAADASTSGAPGVFSANATSEPRFAASATSVLREIYLLFRDAVYEDFEFGRESEFVRLLESEIVEHGATAIQAIARLILTHQVDARVAGEALRWLGRLDYAQSYHLRFNLLTQSLRDPSRWVRDGAVLGLYEMKDRRSIPVLEAAIKTEPIGEMRRDMADVLRRLQNHV